MMGNHALCCFLIPLGLYPKLEELGDYMGLSLTSDEVQKNLALIPAANNVSVCGYGCVCGT